MAGSFEPPPQDLPYFLEAIGDAAVDASVAAGSDRSAGPVLDVPSDEEPPPTGAAWGKGKGKVKGKAKGKAKVKPGAAELAEQRQAKLRDSLNKEINTMRQAMDAVQGNDRAAPSVERLQPIVAEMAERLLAPGQADMEDLRAIQSMTQTEEYKSERRLLMAMRPAVPRGRKRAAEAGWRCHL